MARPAAQLSVARGVDLLGASATELALLLRNGEVGAREVEDLLGRIEYGVFS